MCLTVLSMEKSTRYFQLAPDILVEYKYNELGNASDQTGDATGHIHDMNDGGYVIYDNYNFTRNFLCRDEYLDGFVLPINKSESKFKLCKNRYDNEIWNQDRTNFTSIPLRDEQNVGNGDPDDILIDNFTLHFTSRNYLGGSYDGFIITVSIYDTRKNKINLLSQYIRKTDDPDINENPFLINQKLYTTYKDFFIPNVSALLDSNAVFVDDRVAGTKNLRNKLSPGYAIMENSPIMMSIYGVKATYTDNDYESYNVEKLNTIYIPVIDKTNSLYFEVKEATRNEDSDLETTRTYDYGDYFVVYPVIDSGESSFSDYLYNISDGRPELYMVFHELTLIEHVTVGENVRHFITHREQFIINGGLTDYEKEVGGTTAVSEDELERILYYRPVIRNSANCAGFTISVKTYIFNSLDNTTIVKNSSRDFGPDVAKKYGIHMNKIYLGEIPTKVRVYNKKPDIDVDLIKITNASSNVKIENHQHSVIGFIECTNVGVSIEQIPTEQLQQ